MTPVSANLLVFGLRHVAQGGTARLPASHATRPPPPVPVPVATEPAAPGVQASSTAVRHADGAGSSPAETTPQEVRRQLKALQAKMDKLNPDLAFVVDDASGRTLIQLTDRVTKEVLQQYPTEVALRISKALDQFQKGQLLSKLA